MNIKNFKEYQQLNEDDSFSLNKKGEFQEDEFNEETGERTTFEDNDELFVSSDGWDKKSLEDVELMDWLSKVYDFSYEINSCRRGSYAIDGDTASDLLNSLREIQEQLKIVIENIEDEILDNENKK